MTAATTSVVTTANTDLSRPLRQQMPRKQESYDFYLYGNDNINPINPSAPLPPTPALAKEILFSRKDSATQHAPTRPAYSDSLSDHIIALPPFSSPSESPRSSSPATRSVNPTLSAALGRSTFGLPTEERLAYRSWREGRPVLGGRIMATGLGAEPGASVDKKIEATLPRSDQPNLARSRKTSHFLGIFKQHEGTTEQKRDDRRHDILEEEILPPAELPLPPDQPRPTCEFQIMARVSDPFS